MKDFKIPEKDWIEKQTKEREVPISKLTKEIKDVWDNLPTMAEKPLPLGMGMDRPL